MSKFFNEKEYALNNAIASLEIEGYSISENEKSLCLSVLNGELKKDEFIKIILKRCAV